MWTSAKATLKVIGNNIPVGFGIALGSVLAIGGMNKLGRGMVALSDSIKNKVEQRKVEKAVQTAAVAAAAGVPAHS